MKKVISILAIGLLLPFLTSAHPGRTASDGCHYCRTNCSYWGEIYGARHCHGGGSSYSPPTYNFSPNPSSFFSISAISTASLQRGSSGERVRKLQTTLATDPA